VNSGRISAYEHLLRAVGHTGLPGRLRLVRKLAPAYAAGRSFQSDFYGLTYAGDLSELIDWQIFFLGAYAYAELAFLERCARVLTERHGPINFFDVGANAGQHSLFMCRKAREVHAFEPSPQTARRFRHNVSINALDNVVLHEVALADADSEATLGSGFKGNSGSRSLNWSLPGEATETVQVRDASAYFRERKLPIIHLLKIDVEGHERKVLRGLRERLESDRPLILMELIGPPECKGGFGSEDELRGSLYRDHELMSLKERRGRPRLTAFDWNSGSAVVVPSEVRGSPL
jgi:FkbM family methyltransferase